MAWKPSVWHPEPAFTEAVIYVHVTGSPSACKMVSLFSLFCWRRDRDALRGLCFAQLLSHEEKLWL
jgi:hypothetical protein